MTDQPKPVLVIGSLNMDLVARCEHLPEPGQTIMGSDFFTAPGGKGANQAVAAARLGARVSMAGCVGRDAFAASLIAGLREAGVRTDDVVAVDGPTGTALITIDAAGANTIVVISGANAACAPTLTEQALATRERPRHPAAAARDPARGQRTRHPGGAAGGLVRHLESRPGAPGPARAAAAG